VPDATDRPVAGKGPKVPWSGGRGL